LITTGFIVPSVYGGNGNGEKPNRIGHPKALAILDNAVIKAGQ
jgi:hypothetical protein